MTVRLVEFPITFFSPSLFFPPIKFELCSSLLSQSVYFTFALFSFLFLQLPIFFYLLYVFI